MSLTTWKACRRKRRFRSRGEANTALKNARRGKKARRGHKSPKRAYRCPYCSFWHLTHRRSWHE